MHTLDELIDLNGTRSTIWMDAQRVGHEYSSP